MSAKPDAYRRDLDRERDLLAQVGRRAIQLAAEGHRYSAPPDTTMAARVRAYALELGVYVGIEAQP